jgi:CRP-like cAMP-binding protein
MRQADYFGSNEGRLAEAKDLVGPVFHGIPASMRVEIASFCTVYTWDVGKLLYRNDSPANSFLFLVKQGKLKSEYIAESGRHLITYFGSHDMFGELETLNRGRFYDGRGVLSGIKYQNAGTVTVIENATEVVVIPWDRFSTFLYPSDEDHDNQNQAAFKALLLDNFLRFLATRIWYWISTVVENRTKHTAKESVRLCLKTLYSASDNTSVTNYNGKEYVCIEMVLADLLAYTGMTAARYYGIVRDLQEKGIIITPVADTKKLKSRTKKDKSRPVIIDLNWLLSGNPLRGKQQ